MEKDEAGISYSWKYHHAVYGSVGRSHSCFAFVCKTYRGSHVNARRSGFGNQTLFDDLFYRDSDRFWTVKKPSVEHFSEIDLRRCSFLSRLWDNSKRMV